MTLKFDLTKDDILALQKQVSGRNRVFSRPILILIVIGTPAYVLISTKGDLEALYQWLPLIAGLIVFYFLQSNFRLKKNVESWIRNHPEQIGQRKVQLHGNELIYLSPESHTTYDLSTFQKVEESKDHVYLFIGKASAVVIPKRAFKDENLGSEFMSKLIYAH